MKQTKLLYIFALLPALLCMAFINAGNAQTVREFINIDSLKVGDTFSYAITLNRSKQYDKIIFPDSTRLGNSFEIRSRRHYQLSSYKDSLSYKIQFFATTDTTLPPLPIYLVQQQDTTVLYTNPVAIPFNSVLSTSEREFRPLKPIFDFAAAWWPYLLGLGILMAAVYFFYRYYWQRQEQQEEPEKAPFTPTPFVNPIKELQQSIQSLKQEEPSSQEDFKEFYIRLGNAIRRYFEDLYGIPALELTSRELLAMLRRRSIDEDLIGETQAVLQEADMVKFAKFKPSRKQAGNALKKAHNFLSRAREVDRSRIQYLRRKHHARMQTNRERHHHQQKHTGVDA